MKNSIKRIIAFICVLALTIGSVTIWNPVKEVEATEKSTTPTPICLEGFNHVTLENFSLPEGTTYTETKYVQLKDEDRTTPVTGVLDKTVLSLKVKFTQKDTDSYGSLLVMGGDGWNKGFGLRPNKTGAAMGILDFNNSAYPMTTETIGNDKVFQTGVLYASDIDAALGTSGFSFYDEFTLQVSFEYTTEGEQTYLTLTFYVNGKQIKVNERLTAAGSTARLDALKMKIASDKKNHGTYIGFEEYGNGGTLKMSSVSVGEQESTGPTPVYVPGFKHVTLENFGLPEGTTYAETKYVQLKDDDGTTPVTGVLDKTMLSLKVKFTQKDANSYGSLLVMGGDGWNKGFGLRPNKTGAAMGILDFNNSAYPMTTETIGNDKVFQTGVLYASDIDAALGTSGFSFYDEFTLQVSFEYTTEGEQTYLTLTFYVNGKQIKVNERLTAANSTTRLDALKMKISSDKKNHGTYIGFEEYSNGGTLKMSSVSVGTQESTGPTPVYLPGFNHVTLENFGLSEGKTYNETTYAQLKGDDGKTPVTGVFDKTVLSVKVKFTQKNTDSYGSLLVMGGDGWNKGFGLRPNKTGAAMGILDFNNSVYPMTAETIGNDKVFQTGVLYASDIDAALGTSGFSFYDEFTLQVSFEYTTEGEQTYLTLTFYVNGKQIKVNERLTAAGSTARLDALKMKISSDKKNHGTYIGFEEYGNGGTLKISSVSVTTQGGTEPGPSEPGNEPKPETLKPDESFKKITFSHFNVPDETYIHVAGEPSLRVLEKTEISLDKTVFAGDVLLAEGKKLDIRYGGIKAEQGLRFEITADGKIHLMWIADSGNEYVVKNINSSKAGTDLFGKWLNLKISTEIIDADDDGKKNDIRLAIWFNDIAYDNSYIIVQNKAELLGSYFSIACQETGASVQVRSIPELVDPIDPEDVVVLNESFKKITFSHFNVSDDTYTYVAGEPSLRVLEKAEISLNRTVFSGDVLLAEGKKSNIRYGGIKAEHGLMFEVKENKTIDLVWIAEDGNEYIITGITSTKAKTDLFGDWLNLKISTEIIDADKDGKKNDIRMAIWFNDIAYKNSYIIVRNKAHLLGNYFSIACQEEGASVKVRSIPELMDPVNPEDVVKLNKSFKKITFSHFNVWDDTYSHVAGEPSLRVLEKAEISLNKTVFSGDVLLAEGKKLNIRYGGIKAEHGLMFDVKENKTIDLVWIAEDGNEYIVTGITPTKAKTDLFGDWLNLKISTEIIVADKDGKKDDIRMAIWFNDIAYKNSYIIVRNKAHLLGSYLSIACQDDGAFVKVRSIPELMDPVDPDDIVRIKESFKKITFSHLAIEDGTYSYAEGEPSLRVLGRMKTSVDKTVFSGDILLAKGKKLNFRYGGIKAEHGLMFYANANGTIDLVWIAEGGNEYIVTGITSTKAKTDLFGKWLNLKISTEIVDADKDGKKNDIRMGIWFNDIPYNNRYIIIRDKADLLGSYFSIACQEKGASVKVRSIPELIEPFDYAWYGLTQEWEETLLNTDMVAEISIGGSKTSASPTGDRTDVAIPIVAVSVSVIAILLYVFVKRRGKIEA